MIRYDLYCFYLEVLFKINILNYKLICLFIKRYKYPKLKRNFIKRKEICNKIIWTCEDYILNLPSKSFKSDNEIIIESIIDTLKINSDILNKIIK